MFHAVGLNVMDPMENKSDVLEASRRALRDIIAEVVERPAKTHGWQKSRAENPRV
jgi:hypothetical protein